MKAMKKKLSSKYVKLQNCRLRQDSAVTTEGNSGELCPEINVPDNGEPREAKTPRATKIIKAMQRKIMSKEKASDDQEPSVDDHSIHMNGRDRLLPSEGLCENGQDSSYEGLTPIVRNQLEQREDSNDECDLIKDYHDWIVHVEESSYHCFDLFECYKEAQVFEELQDFKKDGLEHDRIRIGQSEGYIESNNDKIHLLKSSKKSKHKQRKDSKHHKKDRNRKHKGQSKEQHIDLLEDKSYGVEKRHDPILQCRECKKDSICINIKQSERSDTNQPNHMGHQSKSSPKIGNDFIEWSEGCRKNKSEWIDKFDEYLTNKIVSPRPKRS